MREQDDGSRARAADVVASVVAAERARLVGGLIRVTGDWDLAEDCVQDAVETALSRWPADGLPRNPAAWLTTVARNRALDVLRRRASERSKVQEAALLEDPPRSDEDPFADDLLRLVFTCCHPALALDNRVALTLRTVAGLSTAQIARAFLVSEATLAQRLLRTRRKIEHAGIPYRVPPPDLLTERTGGVLAVIYLVFNEGYSRRDDTLLTEALRLARLLVNLMPGHDEARGLLALIILSAARRSTRFDVDGELVPMEEQDRSRWDPTLLDDGLWHLRRAASSGRPPGTYRLQAGIAACHATASDAESTDWSAIVELYDGLQVAQPSPVVALNRAIAVGFRDGYDVGLSELTALVDPTLSSYYLVPAARADFLRRLGRTADALAAYTTALDLVPPDGPEARLLHRRIGELGGQGAFAKPAPVVVQGCGLQRRNEPRP